MDNVIKFDVCIDTIEAIVILKDFIKNWVGNTIEIEKENKQDIFDFIFELLEKELVDLIFRVRAALDSKEEWDKIVNSDIGFIEKDNESAYFCFDLKNKLLDCSARYFLTKYENMDYKTAHIGAYFICSTQGLIEMDYQKYRI